MYFKNVHRRLIYLKILLLLTAALWSKPAFSQVKVGLDYSSLQEKRSSTQIASVGRTFTDFYLNIELKRELPLYLTLGYLNIVSLESYDDSTYTRLNSTNPYLGVVYHFFGKNTASLIVGGFYSPYANLSVSEQSGKETWNGTSMIGKLTGAFSLSKRLQFNTSLYYISETFGHRASGSLTSKSSFIQSYVVPSIGFTVQF